MPDFMAQYLTAIEAQRSAFMGLLADAPKNDVENALREAAMEAWNPHLPAPDPEPRDAFAVDGSDAMRGFDNGTFLVVSHALLAGPDMEVAATSVVLQRDTLAADSRERLRGLLTRSLEIGLAVEQIERCAGGTLYLDGSLYAQLGHLIYPYEASTHAELPLTVLDHYLDLVEAARTHRVRLIALSKTTRSHLLAHALLPDHVSSGSNGGIRRDDTNVPSDGEVLARWTHGPGYTTPILVGWEAFGNRAAQFVTASDQLVHGFVRAGVEGDRAAQALDRLRELPAVWAAYARLDDGEDCLRVEFLADEVLPAAPRLSDCALAVAERTLGLDRLAGVIADHTTPRLYNTGLYVADRLVRLSRAMVDDKYLPLLRETLGVPLRLNRSERRFHSF